jgi:hypothetical protein
LYDLDSFTPSAQGSRNATLTVVDTGLSGPQLVTLAPPGYYMLVIVNASGVPSAMPLVQLN